MIDNPFGKSPSPANFKITMGHMPSEPPNLELKHKKEPKEPIIVPLDTPVPESLVPIEREMSYSEKILAEHNGLESNIPINHDYWKLRP